MVLISKAISTLTVDHPWLTWVATSSGIGSNRQQAPGARSEPVTVFRFCSIPSSLVGPVPRRELEELQTLKRGLLLSANKFFGLVLSELGVAWKSLINFWDTDAANPTGGVHQSLQLSGGTSTEPAGRLEKLQELKSQKNNLAGEISPYLMTC